MRATWIKVHLYLALIAGFFFALMGLSGSLGIYREELDELLNPQLVIEEPQGKYQSLDRIMASVRAVHPNRYGSWTLELPRSPHGMITAWYEKPTETFFELYAPLMVSVNPYTCDVVASRFWGKTATTWLLDLHTQFRLERSGNFRLIADSFLRLGALFVVAGNKRNRASLNGSAACRHDATGI